MRQGHCRPSFGVQKDMRFPTRCTPTSKDWSSRP